MALLKIYDVNVISDPICNKRVDNLVDSDFDYYDKDGFELNKAEQKFYTAKGHKLDTECLNHVCFQQTWMTIDKNPTLFLDHCMVLQRCCYTGDAAEQIKSLKDTFPKSRMLLHTRQKWGYDFALDSIDADGNFFEVLHIEYDYLNVDHFHDRLIAIESRIKRIDWHDAANRVNKHREHWIHLKGFAQNDWKSKFLLGWEKSEVIEKLL